MRCIPEEELVETFVRPASGAGGQKCNKTGNAVRLTWNFMRSAALSEEQRARLQTQAASFIAGDCIVVYEHSDRSLFRNRRIARERMNELFRRSLPSPKKRKPTKPTRASKERRLKEKAIRSRIKAIRGSRDD